MNPLLTNEASFLDFGFPFIINAFSFQRKIKAFLMNEASFLDFGFSFMTNDTSFVEFGFSFTTNGIVHSDNTCCIRDRVKQICVGWVEERDPTSGANQPDMIWQKAEGKGQKVYYWYVVMSAVKSVLTKTNPVQASPFKGKSFWWESELPSKNVPPASCLH